jgi:hypothetical protein
VRKLEIDGNDVNSTAKNKRLRQFDFCEKSRYRTFSVVRSELNSAMRRFTLLTTGFSKKVENHEHFVAIHYMHYNFARIHQTMRMTPAMEAGINDHVWSLEEIIGLLP